MSNTGSSLDWVWDSSWSTTSKEQFSTDSTESLDRDGEMKRLEVSALVNEEFRLVAFQSFFPHILSTRKRLLGYKL